MRRKKKRKIRFGNRFKIILFLATLALVFLLAQPVWHVFQIRFAKDSFDMTKMADEMIWVEKKAPWLERIPLVEDSALWLSLNQGETVTDEDLLEHKDDKHRFWLLQLKLKNGQLSEATQILSTISSATTRSLAQGLIDMVQGEYESALNNLNAASELKMTKDEKVLKRLAVSRCLLAQGDEQEAESQWKKAEELAPAHPLVIEEEFDLALVKAEWSKAEDLLLQMEQWPGNDDNLDLQTKKGLLYLTLGQSAQWEDVLEKLSQSSKGKSYRTYLLGMQKYQKGEWKAAQALLEEAVKGELSPAVFKDASQALIQLNERLAAEKALQKY